MSTRTAGLALSLARNEASRPEVTASFESYDPSRDPSMRPSPFQAYVRVQFGCVNSHHAAAYSRGRSALTAHSQSCSRV